MARSQSATEEGWGGGVGLFGHQPMTLMRHLWRRSVQLCTTIWLFHVQKSYYLSNNPIA